MTVVGLLLVATFYSGTHLRNRFSTKHSGQDVGGWRAGTSIPSPVVGTVAGFGWHRNYGYWVSIRLASGWYVTFSHMLRATPLKRGATVVVGTLVGQVGASGAFAVGFHVHVGYGRGMYPWSRPTSDPLPIIRKGTQPAAVVVKPIPPTSLNPATKAKNMSTIYYTTDDNKASHAGNKITLFALAGESPGTSANWLETTSSAIKDSWSGGHGPGVFLTSASFESFKARHLEPLKIAGGAGAGIDEATLVAALRLALKDFPEQAALYGHNLLKQQMNK